MTNTSGDLPVRSRSATVFVRYIWPVVLGSASVLYCNLVRIDETLDQIGHLICRLNAMPDSDFAQKVEKLGLGDKDDTLKQLGDMLKAHEHSMTELCVASGHPECLSPPDGGAVTQGAGGGGVDAEPASPDGGVAATRRAPVAEAKAGTSSPRGRDRPWHRRLTVGGFVWAANAMPVFLLVIFPFVSIGARMAWNEASSIRAGHGPSDMAEYAARSWVMKLILGVVMSLGWLYVLGPNGQAATAVSAFVRTQQAIAANTRPVPMDPGFTLTPLLAAFVGWFLYLAAYTFYRARRDDVRSVRLYGVLFRKLLFALAVGSILNLDKNSTAAAVAALLVGFVPFSALTVLKDYGLKVGGSYGTTGNALTDLPGISTWEVARLEEEGVDSVGALLMTSRDDLQRSLPMSNDVIELWYDQAALMVVVGPERYAQLRNVCQTASHFVAQSGDAKFCETVKATAKIENVPEIAELLRRRFGPATPPQLTLA